MNTEQLMTFMISPDSTVVEAMERIDRNARGILFVTNEQQKLLGVVTDGDIRRWLIRTGELKAPVSGLMNTEPKRISRKEHAKAHEVMVQHSITALPVVTTKGVVSDILFRDEQVAKKKKPQVDGLRLLLLSDFAARLEGREFPYLWYSGSKRCA